MKHRKYHIVPIVVFGVTFHCVERDDGQIMRYCDSKERAQQVILELLE